VRDPKRIRKFCNRLATAWELVPDLRFGQLLFNIFVQIKNEGKDPFYLEDDSMIKRIEQYIENHTGVALHE
jgi:hypothetical protein